MSDTDVMDRDERASALDAFARQDDPDANRGSALTIPGQAFAAAPDRAFGAQKVQVYRDEGRVLQKVKALAAAAGDDWYYRFPVKNKRENRTDYIEGPSIKLANDLARLYGNCEIDTRVIDLGDSWLIYARFTDFETGFALTRPFQQRKSQRSMKGDADRALDIAFQIGVSKAIRNVTVNALQTFADFAFDEARNALIEKVGRKLPEYRDRILARLDERQVDVRRVEAIVGRIAAEWLATDVARVIAMLKAVTDGMATLDETFPPIEKSEASAADKAAPQNLDGFAKGEGGSAGQGAGPSASPTKAGTEPAQPARAGDKTGPGRSSSEALDDDFPGNDALKKAGH